QGYARGLDMDMIRSLNDQASWGLKPDVTVLLDCPVEVGLNRAIQRIQNEQQEGQDRFERETLAFHRKVKTGYMGLAETEAERFVVVDGTLGEDELESVIFEKIRNLVP
ncbi:MAG: dTMP kinase, partial [Deltaproteobacteria bacterium]|nr:dTMP kinase [Deltaproteobacteria bacterium]